MRAREDREIGREQFVLISINFSKHSNLKEMQDYSNLDSSQTLKTLQKREETAGSLLIAATHVLPQNR